MLGLYVTEADPAPPERLRIHGVHVIRGDKALSVIKAIIYRAIWGRPPAMQRAGTLWHCRVDFGY